MRTLTPGETPWGRNGDQLFLKGWILHFQGESLHPEVYPRKEGTVFSIGELVLVEASG